MNTTLSLSRYSPGDSGHGVIPPVGSLFPSVAPLALAAGDAWLKAAKAFPAERSSLSAGRGRWFDPSGGHHQLSIRQRLGRAVRRKRRATSRATASWPHREAKAESREDRGECIQARIAPALRAFYRASRVKVRERASSGPYSSR